jgi:pimeloyl-ACP methyl ester carboxylesterase
LTESGEARPDARTSVYWESTGTGDPVLLIGGLGLSGGTWWRTVATLSQRFRVVTYDHRGVGRSRSRSYAYTTAAMAEDAIAVLDEAGIEHTHVYGMSLGGMIAQELALRHPGRVRSLILGATQPGGRRAVSPEDEVLSFFRRRPNMPHEEAAWASVPYSYGPRCRQEMAHRIADDLTFRLAHPFNPRAYRAQLIASAWHNCVDRLSDIHVPTLIVHGDQDRVLPVGNAYVMAELIPAAQLHVLEGIGHLYTTEAIGIDDTIGDFLAAVAHDGAFRPGTATSRPSTPPRRSRT